MKPFVIVLIVIFHTGLAAIYSGIGYGIAWVVDKAIDTNVNYTIFVVAALVVYIVQVAIHLLGLIWANKQKKEMECEFDKWGF